MNTVTIESVSVEPLTVTLRVDDDPTGDAIEFAVTPAGATDPGGSWSAGTWGTWANGIVRATTPSLGGSGAAIGLTEDTPVTLWCRIGGSVVLAAARIVPT